MTEEKKTRVFVATPSGDQLQAHTSLSIHSVDMQLAAFGCTTIAGISVGTYVEMGQNTLIQTALEHKCDYVLFLDSDMIFPAHLGVTLLKHDKDIVGCNYRRRQPPHLLTTTMLDGNLSTWSEEGLQEVQHVASGAMMVNSKILRRMSYPWFFNYYGNAHTEFRGNDVNFGRKARDMGASIWCDFDLSKQIGHLAQLPIWLHSVQEPIENAEPNPGSSA